jgi:hypothetical protein
MSETSTFTSRPAGLACNAPEFYNFVTDVTNFRQFLSSENFSNLIIEKDSISFQVNLLGKVSLNLTEKEMYKRVVYKGDNQQVNDFSLIIEISDSAAGNAMVVLTFQAELDPALKMLASGLVNRYLDMMIVEMEAFRDWNVPRQ